MINHKTSMLVACIAITALSTGLHAQSTSGGIAGEAKAGDTVYVVNNDTGFKRELAITKDGKYQVRNVPLGAYQVIHKHSDGSFEPSQQVTVKTGAMSRIQGPGAADPEKTAQ